jgi:glucose-6-phosphate dehydrogenase assembly protein OpcA
VSASPSEVLVRMDAELRALWSSSPGAPEPPKARACTRNLVVVAGTPEVADRWVRIVDDVLLSVPARAIVVGLDLDGADGLDATATAVCTPSAGGGPAVCSERVTLVAHGGVCLRLASCVRALCANDVPTTLVWLGRVHADDPAFAPLARDADRIVLDASQGSLASLAQMVRWAQGTNGAAAPSGRGGGGVPVDGGPGVADLAWTRLAPWQELCARMFDEPRLRELALRVSRVGIVQASSAGAALGSEGGLLLGWLATRLGWKATSLAGKLRLTRPHEGTVRAQLRAEPSPDVPRGTLLAIEIEAAFGGVSLHGVVRRDEETTDAATWKLEVTRGADTTRIEQRVRLRASEPARLLERTLRRPPHDLALAESAAWADELRGEELACG